MSTSVYQYYIYIYQINRNQRLCSHILGYDIQRLIVDLNGVTALIVLHIPLNCPSWVNDYKSKDEGRKDLEQRSILRNDKGTVDVTASFWSHDSFMVAAPYWIGSVGKRCSLGGGVVAHWRLDDGIWYLVGPLKGWRMDYIRWWLPKKVRKRPCVLICMNLPKE